MVKRRRLGRPATLLAGALLVALGVLGATFAQADVGVVAAGLGTTGHVYDADAEVDVSTRLADGGAPAPSHADVSIAPRYDHHSQLARPSATSGEYRLAPQATRSAYSVAFETQLDDAVLGSSRSVHFNRANAALDDALRSDTAFATQFDEMIPGASSAVSLMGGRATPAGYTWHHVPSSAAGGRVGVMQLVPTWQHAPGSIWQRLVHPGGSGGLFGMGDSTGSPEVGTISFSVTHIDGSMERPDDVAGFPALLDELNAATSEHGDVAVGHESGWTLTVLTSGRVVWENVEEGGAPQHLDGLSRDETLELMELVASGDTVAVESWSWSPGYGS